MSLTGAALIAEISADRAEMIEFRHDLHACPELAFEETRTAAKVRDALTRYGLEVETGIGNTGLVATIHAGTSRRAVGLRADMDALPIGERNRFAHASMIPAKMHACGHDGHTAMLLAAAKYLAKHRNFDGIVHLIFQPAEESGGGARQMIRDGLLNRFPMEAIFGMHNWPGLEVGKFAVRDGAAFAASTEFQITVRGRGCHAAMPERGTDAILACANLVPSLMSITNRGKSAGEPMVISVTSLKAGQATNVIPDECELRGTVRTFDSCETDRVVAQIRRIARGICDAHGVGCDIEICRSYPATINHPRESSFVRASLRQFAGAENVIEQVPTMGTEDFSYFLQELPGCYFLIGNGSVARDSDGNSAGLHNPFYDFNDELIVLGASMWVHLVENYFKSVASKFPQ